jgi:hypothetical protein
MLKAQKVSLENKAHKVNRVLKESKAQKVILENRVLLAKMAQMALTVSTV